ncbi:hypothetical protein TNCV_4804721 [Trichonephila clavipes]|nr:hypothetical protein TNCV_4804721 [Trichonephila clavipes]
MRGRAYCAHPRKRDRCALRRMSRCPDKVASLKQDAQCLSLPASLVLIYRPTAIGIKATRVLLVTDLVILNHGQVTRTTSEQRYWARTQDTPATLTTRLPKPRAEFLDLTKIRILMSECLKTSQYKGKRQWVAANGLRNFEPSSNEEGAT